MPSPLMIYLDQLGELPPQWPLNVDGSVVIHIPRFPGKQSLGTARRGLNGSSGCSG